MTLIFILLVCLSNLQAQDVYYKSVNTEYANDSISEFVDSVSDLSIRFSQHSYWASRGDTTTKPNLINYNLYIYKDSIGKSYAIIVSPYFISVPYQREFRSIKFFELFQKELLKTNLRPDKRDAVVDTSYFEESGLPLNDSTYMFAAYYPHRGIIKDGTRKRIILTKNDSLLKISYDRRLVDPFDYYYQYNSRMPFYTLTLLLENDWQKASGSIEWDLELAQQGILTEEQRIKWMLEQVPKRQEELKEFKKYLKLELKELKK